MSSPPRTLPDRARAEPPSPSRDELMPQQPQRLPRTPARGAKSPDRKKGRQGGAAPPAGDMEIGQSVPATSQDQPQDSLSPKKMQPLKDALAGTGDAQALPVQKDNLDAIMQGNQQPEPPAIETAESEDDESNTQRQQMRVVKDWKGRTLVAFDDLGEQVAALAGVPPQSASRQSVLYGENFAWDNTLELLFLYPVLWNSAHSEFIVTKYFKKGGDDVTAATEAVADACRPAFLNLVERTPGKITIAVTLGSGQKSTGGPVADLAKALANMSPRVEYVDVFKREIPLRKSPFGNPAERVRLQSQNPPDVIPDEFQKCHDTTLFILDGIGASGAKLQAAKNQADAFSKARGMNVRTGLLVVGLSVEETDNRYRPNLLTPRLQCRFDAVADRLLAGDGPQSRVDGKWGAILYIVQLKRVRRGLYVGSAKAPEDDWETYGKDILKATTRAIKNGHAAEAVRLLKLCLRSRMSGHQSSSRTGKDTAMKREWFWACDAAVKGNPYMKGASPVLAFWSLKGETEQQFYRRVVLALEELLLGTKEVVLNTQRWALGIGVELVFDPEQDKEVPCQVTKEALGRRNATNAQKTCVQVAAAALAEAGGNADVFAAARKLHDAALDLQGADRITKRDAHSAFRAAEYRFRAARAVADARGDAAVESARALANAAAAVDRAVEGVKAFEDLDRKIAARRRLVEAEAAFKTLYDSSKRQADTHETTRRFRATLAAKTCGTEAALARARAGDSATLAGAALDAVARKLDAAAKKLNAAPRGTTKLSDAHMMYRAAECCWRAALASTEADDDDAATHARTLCVVAKAVDAAAKRVGADVEPDIKLAARQQLQDAEEAFKTLYKQLERARHPRPTSRAARRRPQQRVVASQAKKRAEKAAQRPKKAREDAVSALNKAVAMASDGVTPAGAALIAVRAARAFDAAVKRLDAAHGTTTPSDAYADFRAAKRCWRAAVASAEAVDKFCWRAAVASAEGVDDAAVARARDLGAAAAAVDAAARRFVDALNVDAKLAARVGIEAAEAAEDAFKTLCKQLERARRPRPTSRTARRRPTAVASQAAKAAEELARIKNRVVASRAQRGAVDQTMQRAATPRAVAGEVEAPAAPAPDDEEMSAALAPDDLQAPAAPASDDAPAPDGSTDRARQLVAFIAPAVFKRLTETALGVPVGTSQAFAEAVTAQSEKIRCDTSSQLMQQHNFSEPEARFATVALEPSIRKLAVAELLGDAAPAPDAMQS